MTHECELPHTKVYRSALALACPSVCSAIPNYSSSDCARCVHGSHNGMPPGVCHLYVVNDIRCTPHILRVLFFPHRHLYA